MFLSATTVLLESLHKPEEPSQDHITVSHTSFEEILSDRKDQTLGAFDASVVFTGCTAVLLPSSFYRQRAAASPAL
jgi:hypothetical protein